jgi:hypothetical protein
MNQKLEMDTETDTQDGDVISLLLFFQNKDNRLTILSSYYFLALQAGEKRGKAEVQAISDEEWRYFTVHHEIILLHIVWDN